MWEVLLTNERKSEEKSKIPPADVIGGRFNLISSLWFYLQSK